MKNRTAVRITALLSALMICAASASCTPRGAGADTDSGESEPPRLSESGHKLAAFEDDGDTYTYRISVGGLPTSWNRHRDGGDGAELLLGYTTDTLYKYEYNEDFTGFTVVPSMAEDYPDDVSGEYAGSYGIEDGETGRAYRIRLRAGLRYDTGDAITADDFESSARLLLGDSESVLAETFFDIVGAEDYFLGGRYVLRAFISDDADSGEYVDDGEFTESDGILYYDGMKLLLDMNDGGGWSVLSLRDYADAHYLDGEDAGAAYEKLSAAARDDGIVEMTRELVDALRICIAALDGYENVDAAREEMGEYADVEFEEMLFLGREYEKLDYEGNVGLFAESPHSLVLVFSEPRANDFWLLDRLATDLGLVYGPVYERCVGVNEAGDHVNIYATGVETYAGFGPYKLNVYAQGSRAMLERNEFWHGYGEDEYIEGTYMTDRVEITVAPDSERRLSMFLTGQLDECALEPSQARMYLGGSYTGRIEKAPVWIAALNPDLATLSELEKSAVPTQAGREVNKTILTIPEFRRALSLSIDRDGFVRTLSPTSSPATGLFSRATVARPDLGVAYRDTDEGRGALSFYPDGAVDGFDADAARALFDDAYETAVSEGLLSADAASSGEWEVQITIGKPTNDEYWTRGIEFLSDCWADAVVGTKFEGRLVIRESRALGQIAYSDALRRGDVDMLFSVGFGGDPLDPYSTMCDYVGDIAYDSFTDKNAIAVSMSIDVDGDGDDENITAALGDMIRALAGGVVEVTLEDGTTAEFSPADPLSRCEALASCEAALIEYANVIPLFSDAETSLRGERLVYAAAEPLPILGTGGVEWLSYTMDDEDFAEYISSRGGELEYR